VSRNGDHGLPTDDEMEDPVQPEHLNGQ
jgi:hypothetical protein